MIADMLNPAPPGMAHHKAETSIAMIATVPTSQGFLRPMRSTVAPRSGAISMTSQPAYLYPVATRLCPCTGSAMTVVTR